MQVRTCVRACSNGAKQATRFWQRRKQIRAVQLNNTHARGSVGCIYACVVVSFTRVRPPTLLRSLVEAEQQASLAPCARLGTYSYYYA